MDKGDEGNEKILIRKSSNMSEHSIDVYTYIYINNIYIVYSKLIYIIFLILYINEFISSCLNADFVNEEQQRRLFAELGLNDAQKKSFKKFKKKLNTENLKLKTLKHIIFKENIVFYLFLLLQLLRKHSIHEEKHAKTDDEYR